MGIGGDGQGRPVLESAIDLTASNQTSECECRLGRMAIGPKSYMHLRKKLDRFNKVVAEEP